LDPHETNYCEKELYLPRPAIPKRRNNNRNQAAGYTQHMLRTFFLDVTFVLALLVTSSPSLSAQAESPEVFALGVAIPKVTTLVDSQQSYALYLPTSYSREKIWPVVYVFDPAARGGLAVQQFQHAAQLHGFIIAASNNSRNGPWAPELEAANAVVRDTQQRLSVDLKRIYFAGFSGGARVASQLAQICKCAAGVLLSGAGFSRGSVASQGSPFAVFSAVGNADFNYSEIIPLQDTLQKAAFASWLRVFDGSHQWAPPEIMDEALAWFRVQSMKTQRAPRDDEFLAAQFLSAQNRALLFEKDGDLLAAWREYRQIAATYDALRQVSAIRAKATELEKEKALKDVVKHEKNDFEEQERLSNEILAAFSATDRADSQQSEALARALVQAKDLRLRAANEKKPQRALVFKRALAGVFIGSMESGGDALEKKNYASAAQQFACATEANPESEWAWRNLAVARAFSGDRKGTIDALRSARTVTTNPAGFSDWLNHELAFEKLHSVPEFQHVGGRN